LTQHQPVQLGERHNSRRSAVCVIAIQTPIQLEVVMIRRASHPSDPWSGQMAFPGGRIEPTDKHSFAAAVRECREEIGVDLNRSATSLGRLSERPTHIKAGPMAMLVTPYVFGANEPLVFQPNYEVAEVVTVPLSLFMDFDARSTFEFDQKGQVMSAPCYRHNGDIIWGLSLRVIDELLEALGMVVPPWTPMPRK